MNESFFLLYANQKIGFFLMLSKISNTLIFLISRHFYVFKLQYPSHHLSFLLQIQEDSGNQHRSNLVSSGSFYRWINADCVKFGIKQVDFDMTQSHGSFYLMGSSFSFFFFLFFSRIDNKKLNSLSHPIFGILTVTFIECNKAKKF